MSPHPTHGSGQHIAPLVVALLYTPGERESDVGYRRLALLWRLRGWAKTPTSCTRPPQSRVAPPLSPTGPRPELRAVSDGSRSQPQPPPSHPLRLCVYSCTAAPLSTPAVGVGGGTAVCVRVCTPAPTHLCYDSSLPPTSLSSPTHCSNSSPVSTLQRIPRPPTPTPNRPHVIALRRHASLFHVTEEA